MDRRVLRFEHLDPLAHHAEQRAQLANLVAKAANVLGKRSALTEIANHFPCAPAETSVELAIDQPAQRRDRCGIADHGERLERRRLDAEVLVDEQELDPLAHVARLAILAAAHQLRERTGCRAASLRGLAPLRAVDEEPERAVVARLGETAIRVLANHVRERLARRRVTEQLAGARGPVRPSARHASASTK